TSRREIRRGQAVSVLNPNQYVGVVLLPSGLHLEISPKIPIHNLFYMMSHVFKLEPFRLELARFERFEDVLALIARLYARVLQRKIDSGLYRSYVEREDNLRFLRGRLDFAEDLRQNVLTRHRMYCRYTDLTWDIEENQILRQVAHLLSGWGFDRDI